MNSLLCHCIFSQTMVVAQMALGTTVATQSGINKSCFNLSPMFKFPSFSFPWMSRSCIVNLPTYLPTYLHPLQCTQCHKIARSTSLSLPNLNKVHALKFAERRTKTKTIFQSILKFDELLIFFIQITNNWGFEIQTRKIKNKTLED